MRLIDADALIDDIKSCLWDWESVDGITATTVLKQTIADIENQPTVSGWVSVKDKLPDKPCGCLVFNIYGWRALDFWEGDGWAVSDENEITHWMPLPEPPKEVERNGNLPSDQN